MYFDCTKLCAEATATAVFCKKCYSLQFRKIHWKIHVQEPYFIMEYLLKEYFFGALFLYNLNDFSNCNVFLEQKITLTP